MRRSSISRLFWFLGVVGLCALLGTMVWLASAARQVSTGLRREFSAPGPPVTRANLSSILGDVPLAPFLSLDEAATNDPRTHVQAYLTLGRRHGQRVLVFSSTETYPDVTSWYQAHLRGWFVDVVAEDRNQRGDRPRDFHYAAWARGPDRLALVQTPDFPNRILMLVSR